MGGLLALLYLIYMVMTGVSYSFTNMVIIPASGGPLVLLVETDEGVKFSDGVLIDAAESANQTQAQQDLINQRERGFRMSYSLTPC